MTRNKASGFSMVEIMVSILVLSVGVLGTAGMQLSALRTTHQSGLTTMALQLATEMADRMRANDSQMRQSDSNNHFLNLDYSAAKEGEPKSPTIVCYSEACDPAELAQFDLYEWKKRLRSALPSARAVICRDKTPWDSSTGALTWECDGSAGEGASLVIKIGWLLKNPDGSIGAGGGDLPPAVALIVAPYVL